MRLRYDNSLGTLGAPLGGSSTDNTITFQSAPDWATIVAPDYIPLVMDPPTNSPNASFEIGYVTAYTAGATTATISRGMEGTSPVAHGNGASWEVAPTALDLDIASSMSAFVGASGTSGTLSFTHPAGTAAGDLCCIFAGDAGAAMTVSGASASEFGVVTLPGNTGYYGNTTLMLAKAISDVSETISLSIGCMVWCTLYLRGVRNIGSISQQAVARNSAATVPSGLGPAAVVGASYGTSINSGDAGGFPAWSSSDWAVQAEAHTTSSPYVLIRAGFAANSVPNGQTVAVVDLDWSTVGIAV